MELLSALLLLTKYIINVESVDITVLNILYKQTSYKFIYWSVTVITNIILL